MQQRRFRQNNRPQIHNRLPEGVYIRKGGNPDLEIQVVVQSCKKNGKQQPIYVLASAASGLAVDEVRITDFARLYRRV